MAEKKKQPTGVLTQLLSNGNVVNPEAQLDISQYLPTYTQTPEEEARARGELQYAPQIRALQQSAREAALENERARQIEQRYGAEIDPRLANVYSALGNSLTGLRGETSQNYQSAVDQIRGFYNEASKSGQEVNTDILNRLAQSAQQLGVGAAVPDATQRLMEDYQFQQGQLAGSKAGRSSNLASLASEIFGLDTQRIGSAAREGAQVRGQAQNEVLRALSELLFAGQQEQRQFREGIAGLRTDQANTVAQMLHDIQQSRSQEEVEARTRALQEFVERAQLANQNRQMEEQRRIADREFAEQQRQFNEQIRQAELDRAQSASLARLAASSGGGGGGGSFPAKHPLDELYKVLQIEELQNELSTTKLTGQKALEHFLNSPNKYWTIASKNPGVTAPKAGPVFRSKVELLINTANRMAQGSMDPKTGTVTRKKSDPYQVALSLVRAPRYKTQNPAALRSAIDAYYKGVTAKR